MVDPSRRLKERSSTTTFAPSLSNTLEDVCIERYWMYAFSSDDHYQLTVAPLYKKI